MKPTYQQVHIDRPLTNISVAYLPGRYIAEMLFPRVPVQQITDKYFVYDKGDWLRSEAGNRAPGTKAPRGGYALSTQQYTCVEIAIAMPVPDEIVANADDPLRPLADATRWTTEQIFLKKEKKVAALAFGNSQWSASATPSVLWSNDTSDPIGDVEGAAEDIVSSIGQEANVGTMGREVWSKLKNHPDIVDRIKGAAGPGSPAVVTLNAVASLFGLDRLLVGTAIENTAAEGKTASTGFVWGKHFLVAYVTGSPALLAPSAGYVFTYQTRETSRFREDQERTDIVETRESFDEAVVAADAGYLLKSVVA